MRVRFLATHDLSYPLITCSGCPGGGGWYGGGPDLHHKDCTGADLAETHGPSGVKRARDGFAVLGSRAPRMEIAFPAETIDHDIAEFIRKLP